MILNPSLDKLHTNIPVQTPPQSTRFAKLVAGFNIVDTWRSVHPDAQAFSCFSCTHHSMSRIDLILISSSLLPRFRFLSEVTLRPKSLLGHVSAAAQPPPSHVDKKTPLKLLPEDDDILTGGTTAHCFGCL